MKIAILDFLPGHRIAPLLTSFAESNLILHGVVSVLAIHLNLRNLPEICKITRKFFHSLAGFYFIGHGEWLCSTWTEIFLLRLGT